MGTLALFYLLAYNFRAGILTMTGHEMALPGTVQELADVIGTERALYLIGKLPVCYAGVGVKGGKSGERLRKSIRPMLYVPKTLKPNHLLVQILGWQDATKLVRAFGGEILCPANCADIYRQFRDRSIVRMVVTEGMKPADVAELFEISERQVRNLIREIPQQDRPAANDNHLRRDQSISQGTKF